MNVILAPLLRKSVVVFIDYILIYSKSWEDHLLLIKEVLTILQQNQFHVKMSKCSFAKQQLSYLGHIVSGQGVATDPSKIASIKEWPQPQNQKDLRSFLGMVGYYRKFVSQFGLLCKPLTNLLKKEHCLYGHLKQKLHFKLSRKHLFFHLSLPYQIFPYHL